MIMHVNNNGRTLEKNRVPVYTGTTEIWLVLYPIQLSMTPSPMCDCICASPHDCPQNFANLTIGANLLTFPSFQTSKDRQMIMTTLQQNIS